MRRSLSARATAAAVALTSLLAACGTTPASSPTTSRPVVNVDGVLYFAAGGHILGLDLYRVQGHVPGSAQLTHLPINQGATHLGVGGGRAVAIIPVNGVDHLVSVAASGVTPFPSTVRGVGPAISPDGTKVVSVSHEILSGDAYGETDRFHIHVIDIATGSDRVVFSSDDVVYGWGWLSSQVVLVLTKANGEAHLTTVSLQGATRRLQNPPPSTAVLLCSPLGNVIALMDAVNGFTFIIDSDGGLLVARPGYRPLGWSPDGTKLLLVDAGPQGDPQHPNSPGRHLFVAEGPTWTLHSVGTSPVGPIWAAAWVKA